MNGPSPTGRPQAVFSPAESRAMGELNERSREIFRQIVDAYLVTGEPVGSRNVSRVLSMALSPASVRNVMSDLEHAGLIYAPHTSAGRLPTELGLRFFVDALLEIGDLSSEEQGRVEAQMKAARSGHTLETALAEASALLSGVSRGAGVVVTTKRNAPLKHIEFVLSLHVGPPVSWRPGSRRTSPRRRAAASSSCAARRTSSTTCAPPTTWSASASSSPTSRRRRTSSSC